MNYWYLFKSFLVLGTISFGGYMSLISMIRTKLVDHDKTFQDNDLTEAVAIATLLPGPVAVNVVAYIGYRALGLMGAITAVFAVLVPSFLLILLLAFLYFEYETTFDFSQVMIGVIPAVAGVILSVAIRMWRQNCTSKALSIIAGVSALLMFIFNVPYISIIILFSSGIVGLFLQSEEENIYNSSADHNQSKLIGLVLLLVPIILFGLSLMTAQNLNYKIFTQFAGMSLTMFGGGYVMIPILKDLLVNQLNWVNDQDFAVGISLGQVTPGPILISSTFFGFKVNGLIGALVSTFAIFSPAALLMILVTRFYSYIKNYVPVRKAMNAIKAAVVGLIFFSALSLTDPEAGKDIFFFILIIGIVAYAQLRFKVNPPWVILFGGLIGVLYHNFFI